MVQHPVDKRDFLRIPFATQVTIRSGDLLIRSEAGINVSMSGLRISTGETAPSAGSLCSVRILLGAHDNRVAIEAKGKIVRSAPGSLAVEFTELDLDSYHHLQQLIINNAEDPEKAEREFVAHWGIRRPGA